MLITTCILHTHQGQLSCGAALRVHNYAMLFNFLLFVGFLVWERYLPTNKNDKELSRSKLRHDGDG